MTPHDDLSLSDVARVRDVDNVTVVTYARLRRLIAFDSFKIFRARLRARLNHAATQRVCDRRRSIRNASDAHEGA